MKKFIIKTMAIGALLIGMSSCGEDFLTVRPSDKLEAGGPATQKSIEQVLSTINRHCISYPN